MIVAGIAHRGVKKDYPLHAQKDVESGHRIRAVVLEGQSVLGVAANLFWFRHRTVPTADTAFR